MSNNKMQNSPRNSHRALFQNALVSASNKNGLLEFLRPLVDQGLRVVSTGGTSKYLRENGIKVVEVAEQTGFPEVMDGRVRTLHPSIHMPLLARVGVVEDMELLKTNGLAPFDLVIVNLYPFEEATTKNLPDDELIEFIDIGGPSLLRAAAKNHGRIAVVCDPQDYVWLSEKNELSLHDRRKLAAKVFAHTARYDALIARTLDEAGPAEKLEKYFLAGEMVQPLRYGENPQQSAAWFRTSPKGLHEAKILHGKPLSYNNLLDLEAACSTIMEMNEPCAVAVKHNNPCGVGLAFTASSAVERALRADPVSVFGGIVAINCPVDVAAADALSKIFLECIIAPDFEPDAFEKLKKKRDLRLLQWSDLARPSGSRTTPTKTSTNLTNVELSTLKTFSQNAVEFRTVAGGYLAQTCDSVETWPEGEAAWQVLGETPSADIRADLALAWKVCAHLKSNAIALVAGGCTVGLGMGQVNRVDAVEQAIERMKKHHIGIKDVVLASDAFFPFPDSVEQAARAGIRWIVQPGGSIRDEQVMARAKELGISMVLTKVRHFRH